MHLKKNLTWTQFSIPPKLSGCPVPQSANVTEKININTYISKLQQLLLHKNFEFSTFTKLLALLLEDYVRSI